MKSYVIIAQLRLEVINDSADEARIDAFQELNEKLNIIKTNSKLIKSIEILSTIHIGPTPSID